MSDRFSQAHPLWTPAYPAFTNIEAFRRVINSRHPCLNLSRFTAPQKDITYQNTASENYHELYNYSVNNYEFWMDLWQFLGVVYSVPPEKILTLGTSPETPRWFPGARLNYAENILRRNDDSIACTATSESGAITHFSFRRLREMVAEMAAAMKCCGLTIGDRVAAIITNSITAIVIALATASIGAIFTSISPEMGSKAILDRYRQIRPKFIFAETEVIYAGKTIDLTSKSLEIIRDLMSYGLRLAVLLPSTHPGRDILIDSPDFITLSAFLSRGDARPLRFEQLPFDHELFILYSSGTTGTPKCIVHSAGGILLQTMKDVGFCYGVGQDDTLLQYTTTGWMMWNLMVAGLSWGTRLILYDGSPFHPSPSAFLRLVNAQGISVLGVSPRFLAEVHRQGLKPLEIGSFEAMRTLASGGAILTASLHKWAQDAFGKKIRVMSAMGGTDICSAFVTSVLSEPIYAGEIPCRALGIKVEIYDRLGRNIEDTGEAGEMVCTRPHPSIPLYFWGDTSGEKFRSTYYSTYPGVWRQGDFMAVNPITNGVIMLGRSDSVLNRNGIRFGSGEIYSILEKFSSQVEDSICVGQRRTQDNDERIVLFVKMRPGQSLFRSLVKEIENEIRSTLSSRHVPDFILEVEGIPYTSNGKKTEIAVKEIMSTGRNTSGGAVDNPEVLKEYYKYALWL